MKILFVDCDGENTIREWDCVPRKGERCDVLGNDNNTVTNVTWGPSFLDEGLKTINVVVTLG